MSYKYAVYAFNHQGEIEVAERSSKKSAFKIAATVAQRESFNGEPVHSVCVYSVNPNGDHVNKFYFNEDGEMFWEVGRGWGN